MYGVIYVIENKINGKKYVGQTTKGIEKRFHEHARWTSHVSLVSRAIKKYGENNFDVKQLCTAKNQSHLNDLEIKWIKKLKSKVPNGYNIVEGGNVPPINKGRDAYNSRRVVNIEDKRVFDTAGLASEHYGISRESISRCLRGRSSSAGGYNWAYYEDFILGEYTLDKNPRLVNRKVVNIVTKQIFENANEAGELTGIDSNQIRRVCNGNRKSIHNTFWAYYEDFISMRFESPHRVKGRSHNIINLDTMDIYQSISSASKSIKTSQNTLRDCVKGLRSEAGGYRWQYYEDYLKENT